jgi:hypothetical protein
MLVITVLIYYSKGMFFLSGCVCTRGYSCLNNYPVMGFELLLGQGSE